MRPTMPNSTASRCRTGCRTTAGELFTHTPCPSASAIEARKRLCFPDLFLVVSPATVTLEYLSRGLSVCRVGCCLSHQTHYAGLRSALRVLQGLALRKPHWGHAMERKKSYAKAFRHKVTLILHPVNQLTGCVKHARETSKKGTSPVHWFC